MSVQGVKHPLSITKKPHTLEKVLKARPIGEMIASLECARLADGAAVIIIASSAFLEKKLNANQLNKRVDIVGCGETSSGGVPPEKLEESFFTAPEAFRQAY